jgi:hypothetical protein
MMLGWDAVMERVGEKGVESTLVLSDVRLSSISARGQKRSGYLGRTWDFREPAI